MYLGDVNSLNLSFVSKCINSNFCKPNLDCHYGLIALITKLNQITDNYTCVCPVNNHTVVNVIYLSTWATFFLISM